MRRRRRRKNETQITVVQAHALIPGGALDARGARRGKLALEVRAATDKGTPLVMGQVVSTPVRRLLDEGNISVAEARGPEMYINDHDIAYAGMSNPLAALQVDGGARGSGGGMERRAHHGNRHRDANLYLGPRWSRAAKAIFLQETSPTSIGAEYLPNSSIAVQSAGGKFATAFLSRELTDFYGSGAIHPRNKKDQHG